MRYSLFYILLLCAVDLKAQYVYTITADSVKLNSCDSTELIIMNHTQNVPGFLFNTGNGRTIFKRALTSGGNGSVIINAVGDVAVGTSSPHSLFQVTQPVSDGTGTATVPAGSGAVTGVGTEFTNTFKIGDSITITTIYGFGDSTRETHVVTAIASDVSMTTTPFTNWQYGTYTISSREVLAVKGNGNIGIATDAPTSKVDVSGVNGYDQLRLRTAYTPASSSDPNGNVGDFSWDGNYIYIKTSSGWMRSALSTF